MKTLAISSIFVIFALAVGLVSAPAAFADHSEVTIEPAAGSGAPGCEESADGCYIPSEAVVDVGGKVIMSNTDSAAHTFTSGTPSDGPDGVFDTSLLMVGGSFEWSPTTVGEQPYFCMVHPWMMGTIIVQEVGAEESSDSEMGHDDAEMGHSDSEMAHDDADAAMKMPDVHLVSADGSVHVHIDAETPEAGSMGHLNLAFKDMDHNAYEHVNFDIMVMQDGETVYEEMGAHVHDGMLEVQTSELSSDSALDVQVVLLGMGLPGEEDNWTGPIGETFNAQVVPEFGTIAVMILAVAIISIVAFSARSKLSIIPRY